MQTRRDQLQAYRFVTRRIASALTAGNPDSPELPFRRMTGAVLGSVMVAVLAVAGVGIYGALRPGGATSWRATGTLIVEQETSGRYVYLDGVLHPVLNYASARLILKSDPVHVASVSRASLAGVPRGLPVGIPGAPDALPDQGSLSGTPWSVCAEPAQTAAATPAVSVRVRIGATPPGARPLTDGLLVQGGDDNYLIWQGKRFRFADRDAQAALNYGTSQPIPVGAAWLNAMPAGADLAAADVPNRGADGPQIGGTPTRVGEVLRVNTVGNAAQFYLVRADGVQPITQVDAALLLGSPASRPAYPTGSVVPVDVSAADVAAAPHSAAPSITRADQPTTVPRLAQPPTDGTAVCATSSTVSLRPQQPVVVSRSATPTDPATGGPIADRVDVRPGAGEVVRALPAPRVSSGTMYLITDLGYKFPIPTAEALSSLGYKGVTPVPVPVALLQLVPTGPALDPTAATTVNTIR